MKLPEHVTIDWLLSRCTECPCCGEMSNWPVTEAGKKRSPMIDLTIDGRRRKLYVRRVIWQIQHPNGTLPQGLTAVITSRCANKHCIDPNKIIRATKSEAYKQAAERGSWKSPKVRQSNIIAGARRSKLSDEAVLDIVLGGDRAAVAAEKHGISETYVHMLRAGQFRRTVTAPLNPFSSLIR